MQKKIIIFFYIINIVVFTTMFVACKNDIDTVNQITKKEKIPTFDIDTFQLIYSDSGAIKVKIEAAKFTRFEKKIRNYDEYEKGINVLFYNYKSSPEASLKCNYARFFIDKNLWEAKFNVEIKNTESNEKINTEQLFWDMDKELIYSDKFVKITRPDEILWGEGFESNQDFSKYRILHLAGTINIKEN